MNIERVPPDWAHPLAADGGPKPGGHKRLLRKLADAQCTAYQVYESVSEGTPISPVFLSSHDLKVWLHARGHSQAAVENFLLVGTASALFFRDGQPVDGIEALALLSPAAAAEIGAKHRTSIRRPQDV